MKLIFLSRIHTIKVCLLKQAQPQRPQDLLMEALAPIDPAEVQVAPQGNIQDRDHQHRKIIPDVQGQDLPDHQDPEALERLVLIRKLAMSLYKNVKVSIWQSRVKLPNNL